MFSSGLQFIGDYFNEYQPIMQFFKHVVEDCIPHDIYFIFILGFVFSVVLILQDFVRRVFT